MPRRDLDLVATYDWGSCALAYLFPGAWMRPCVERGDSVAFGMPLWYILSPFRSTHLEDYCHYFLTTLFLIGLGLRVGAHHWDLTCY